MVAFRWIVDNFMSVNHKPWKSISPSTTFILCIAAYRALVNILLNKLRYPSGPYYDPYSRTSTSRSSLLLSVSTASCIILAIGGTCYWNLTRVPISNRQQLVLVPGVFEAIGKALSKIENLGSYGENILPAEHYMSLRARKITKRILKAMKELEDDDSMNKYWESLNWETVVVNNSEINAFAYPCGKIVINSGVLDLMSLDSELALLIGHEVGHVVARHFVEQQTARAFFLIFEIMLNQAWTTLAGHWGITLPLSRRSEFEADYMGLMLMARAGYDPGVATTAFQSLNDDYWEWTSPHPSVRTRMEAMAQKMVMNKAMVLLNKTNVSLSY